MATNDKYDRQLRLWGAKGQRALSETMIILIRATSVGTETLKNLILPGIGFVKILDDVEFGPTSLSKSEYSSNFFLEKNSKCSNRAQMACEYLQELNPDVTVSHQHCDKGLKEVILNDNEWCKKPEVVKNLLVIGSDLEPPLLMDVSQFCSNNSIPLIQVQCYGLIGLVRLQCPLLPILDPKPTSVSPDLRLLNPFSQLMELFDAEKIDTEWENFDSHKSGHIPYPLILLKAKKEYSVDKTFPPKTIQEKEEFRSLIKNKLTSNYDNKLNFHEAYNNAYLAYTEKTVDFDHLNQLRRKCAQANLVENASNSSTKSMYLLLTCLEEFVKNHNNQVPLHGTIPDMTSTTDLYVKLQTAYKSKAQEDIAEMKTLLSNTISSCSNDGNELSSVVSNDNLETFCQNITLVDLLDTGHTIHNEYDVSKSLDDELLDDLLMATYDPYEVPEHTPLLWYFGLRGCFHFYQKQSRYPGTDDNQYDQDIELLHQYIKDEIQVYGGTNMVENDFIQQHLVKDIRIATELTRYGNAEIHNISSFVGGMASQEAVKIITGQYIPFNNTYVYNGIASVGAVYKT